MKKSMKEKLKDRARHDPIRLYCRGDRLVAKNGEDSLLVLEDCPKNAKLALVFKDEKGQHALCRYDDGEYGLLSVVFIDRHYDLKQK